MRHGQELIETFNSAGLLSMAKNGSLSSFKAVVEGYPNFVQEMEDPKKLFEAAVQSGNHDLQEYVSNRFFNNHLETLFSPLEIRILVKKCVLYRYSISALLKCLFKGYDLSLFSSKTKEAWSQETLRLDHLESEFLKQVHENLSPFTEQQVESTAIKLRPFKGSEPERLAAFLNAGFLTPEKAMSLLLRRLKNASGEELRLYMEKIAFLFKNNLKYKEIDPDTGNPYVFCITDLDTFESVKSYKEILDVLEKDANFLDIRTGHGLNFLQYMLHGYFNGETEMPFELNEMIKKLLAQGQVDFSSMDGLGFPEEFQTQSDFSSMEEFGFPEEFQTQSDFDSMDEFGFPEELQTQADLSSMDEFGFPEEFQKGHFFTGEVFNSLPFGNPFRSSNVQEWRTRLNTVVRQRGDIETLSKVLTECPHMDVFVLYKELFRTRIEGHSMHKIEETVRERGRMEEDLEGQAQQKFDENPVQTLAEVAEGKLSAHLLRSKMDLIFRDEHSRLPYIHKLFDHFYPNVKNNRYWSVLRDRPPQLSSLFFQLLEEKQNQIFGVFLEWVGFQDFLSVLTQFEMTSFLRMAPSELKKKAFREASSVFEIVEDERDFFSLGLEYLETEEVRTLALSNKKKLKEMGKDGDPRLTKLLESEEKTNLLIELIQEDPDLLEGFASEDGLTLGQNADCLEGARWNWAALLLKARKKGMERGF